MIKVTIIIPVYNGEKHISKCIESILAQTEEKFEVICIDDGSADNSLMLLERYKQNDNRIKVYSISNSGAGAARNVGLAHAKGEYVLFVDIDDYIEKDAIAILYTEAIKDNLDFMFYNFIYENEKGTILKLYNFNKYSSIEKKEIIKLMALCKLPYGAHHLIKTELLQFNECRYSEQVKINEELVFKLKALSYAKKIGFIEYTPYHYVKHPISLSKQTDLYIAQKDTQVLSEIEWLLKENIKDEDEYHILINTFNLNASILYCYRLCRGKAYSLRKTYYLIKEQFLKCIYKSTIIDTTLLPDNVRKLYKLFRLKSVVLFMLVCYMYSWIDNIRIR